MPDQSRAPTPDASTRPVVTWNLDWWQQNGPQSMRPPRILAQAKAVWLLQELKHSTMRTIRESWDGPALSTTEVWPPATKRWLAAGILLPAGSSVHSTGCVETLPRPQRSLWAEADVPGLGRATFISWHTENAAADKPRKMACYLAMHEWLAQRPGPIVLGVDTNSWSDHVDLQPPDPDNPSFEEHDFVGATARHGLVDAHRQVMQRDGRLDAMRDDGADGPLAVSYVLSDGTPHRMDRIYISEHFRAGATSYDYEGALEAGSDHALHEVVLARRS